MKFLKSSMVIVTLFSIGLINTKQVGQKTTAPKNVQPKPINVVPTRVPTPTPTNNPSTFNLAKFTCISASVLPIYTRNQQEYAILTRESRGNPQEQGGKLHTYDDFSGACEAEDNYDPLLSAAREFHEEGNLQKTLGLSLKDTVDFVKNNTEEIIVYTKEADKNIPGSRDIKNVTYIVRFDKYAKKLFDNFYAVIEKEMAHYKKLGKSIKQVTLEKDKIAAVSFDDLGEAIGYQKIISGASPVKVPALVRDSKTTTMHKEQVILRPFLAIKLRSYFLNLPHENGENSKIKYYHR